MLILNNDDVAAVLGAADALAALERVYAAFARSDAVCRPRIDVRIPSRDPSRYFQWGTMEGGTLGGYFAIRMKSDVVYQTTYGGVRTEEKYAVRPGRFCGLVLLVDVETAEPVALMNDGVLQHLRVAADAAIGVKLMARSDARTVGMLGSGGMARDFARAFALVRPVERITVFSPTRENRERYAREMSAELAIPVTAVDGPELVYRGADVLSSCTDSAEPVVRGAWLEPGTHVVSVGGRPDDDARRRFDVRLRFGTAPAPIGYPELGVDAEWLGYLAAPDAEVWRTTDGARPAARVTRTEDVSLADVLAGRAGRSAPEQITYSERGNLQGLQFFAVAGVAYEAARARGLGREIPTEWLLQEIRD